MKNPPTPRGLDLALAKELTSLAALVMALQMAIEGIAQQALGSGFDLEDFRKQLEAAKTKCREKIVLEMETTHPAVAAFLDEDTPLLSEDGEVQE